MRFRYDNERKILVEATDEEKSDLTVNDFLLQKMENVKFLQRKNWDCCFIITGTEGSGKSTLSFVLGQYLTNMGLTLDNIANGSDDAIAKLQSLPDGSVLILDEAELLFASRDTMTKEQKQLTKIFMIIRQKRMVLILVTPSFFDLSKYIAVERSRFLIRVYTDSQLNRGNFAYWGTKSKIKLFYEGKKNHGQYIKPRADTFSTYTDYTLPFDEEYKRIKLETLMKAFEKKECPKRYKKKTDILDYDTY